MTIFDWLGDTAGLTPHGFCLTWNPALLWLDAGADAATMAAYFSIPVAMLCFMRRRRDIQYGWIGLLFAAFILACGSTHGMSILTLWVPAYGLEGLDKLLTAVLSVATAIILWPLVPRLVKLPSAAEVAAKNRELATLNKDLEAFSYSVSHDLRAPLRAINGYGRMLLSDFAADLPEEARAHLDTVVSNSQRMGALIDALLAFAQLGRKPLRMRDLDLAALAREIVADLRPLWGERAIEIVIDPDMPCRGDPVLLRQVLQNLIENAVKYAAGRPLARIRIGMVPGGGEVAETVATFFVADNGIGFDMRYADRLFGVFQRLHGPAYETAADVYPASGLRSAAAVEGLGIGLATVQRIVQRHGGRVWAEADPGRGATFRFTLAPGYPATEPADAPRMTVGA
jgi:signal transduction histidine kinase